MFDREKCDLLPDLPGVYLMYSAKEVIYVGKASSLSRRVRSYFSGNDSRNFVRLLDEILDEIDFIVTQNPKEALLLENTLIKKHQPRFNVLLKDDKTYPFFRLDLKQQWPRIEVTRKIRKDKKRYFGPYHDAAKFRTIKNLLHRHFQLRTCSDSMLKNRIRPCLQYQIKRCLAPCVEKVDQESYQKQVSNVVTFLSGKTRVLSASLKEQMKHASDEFRFEDAALLRDQIRAIEASMTSQLAVQTNQIDRDVIGIFREGEQVTIAVLIFREGNLSDVRHFSWRDQTFSDEEIVTNFLSQYYCKPEEVLKPPKEVLLFHSVTEELTTAGIMALYKKKIRFLHPKKGEKHALVMLANKNAQTHSKEFFSHFARAMETMKKLQKKLHLSILPVTMECFDISNFQGEQIVASQVAFKNALPDKTKYRKIKLRTVKVQDDFASIYEVIERRILRAKKGISPMPDLLVVDGGKGQLNSALEALQHHEMKDQMVISLAKSRVIGVKKSGEMERSLERVFVPGAKNAISLQTHSDVSFLLERIRNEAHRVAISFHRSLRRKETKKSILDSIQGIGKKRKTRLLQHFGSVRAIQKASFEELQEVLPTKTAVSVQEFFSKSRII